MSTNDAAHKFVNDHPQKALLAYSVYMRRLFGSQSEESSSSRHFWSQSAGESVSEIVGMNLLPSVPELRFVKKKKKH